MSLRLEKSTEKPVITEVMKLYCCFFLECLWDILIFGFVLKSTNSDGQLYTIICSVNYLTKPANAITFLLSSLVINQCRIVFIFIYIYVLWGYDCVWDGKIWSKARAISRLHSFVQSTMMLIWASFNYSIFCGLNYVCFVTIICAFISKSISFRCVYSKQNQIIEVNNFKNCNIILIVKKSS